MDIVLVVLDTARGDVTNTLIQDGELPHLAELANSGAFFSEAYANGPWTVPSHGTIFTGQYPSQSGIHGGDPFYESVPLLEELQHRGIETGGFSANPWISSEFGFDGAFDIFYDEVDFYPEGASVRSLFGLKESPVETLQNYLGEVRNKKLSQSLVNIMFWASQEAVRSDSGGSYLLSRAGKWLSKDTDQFAFVNITEPHLPHNIPNKYLPTGISKGKLSGVQQNPALHNAGIRRISDEELDILRETYKATLRYSDDLIGDLVAQTGEDTIFLIIGDHGEHFGEYGRFGHQYSLRKEVLHVPLIISGPGIDSTEVNYPVELRSLYRLILNLAEGTKKLPEKVEHHIAETISPTPAASSLRKKDGSNLPDYVQKFESGARYISDGTNELLQFPDGTRDIRGDSEAEHALQSKIIGVLGEFSRPEDDDMEISDAVESRLDDLGYV